MLHEVVMMKLIKSESGFVLPMAMIISPVGAIIIVPSLNALSTGSLISRHAGFAGTED